MSVICDVIVIFPIIGQFGVIRMPDLTKTKNGTKKSLIQVSHNGFE